MNISEDLHLCQTWIYCNKKRRLQPFYMCCLKDRKQLVNFVQRTRRDGKKEFVFKKGEKVIRKPFGEGRFVASIIEQKLYLYDVDDLNPQKQVLKYVCMDLENVPNVKQVEEKIKVAEYKGNYLKHDAVVECSIFITSKYFIFATIDPKEYYLKVHYSQRLQNTDLTLQFEKRRNNEFIFIEITVNNKIQGKNMKLFFSTKHYEHVCKTFEKIFSDIGCDKSLHILDPMNLIQGDYLKNNEINIPKENESRYCDEKPPHENPVIPDQITITPDKSLTSSMKRRVFKYQYVEFKNCRPVLHEEPSPYNRYEEVILPLQRDSMAYKPLSHELIYRAGSQNGESAKFIAAAFCKNPSEDADWQICIIILKAQFQESTLDQLCNLEKKCGRTMLQHKLFTAKSDIEVIMKSSNEFHCDEEECKVSFDELSALDKDSWLGVELFLTRQEGLSGNFLCEPIVKSVNDDGCRVSLKLRLKQDKCPSINIPPAENVSPAISQARLPISLKTRLTIETSLNTTGAVVGAYWKAFASEIDLKPEEVFRLETSSSPGAKVLLELEQQFPGRCTHNYLITILNAIRRADLAKLVSDEVPFEGVVHDEFNDTITR